jgi:hypothetical protein
MSTSTWPPAWLSTPAPQAPAGLPAAAAPTREAGAGPAADPARPAPAEASRPVPPLGAVLALHDDGGRPAAPEGARLWTWHGAARWYYAAQFPVPPHAMELAPWARAPCPQCHRPAYRLAWKPTRDGRRQMECRCEGCGLFQRHVARPPNPDVVFVAAG